MGLMSYFANFFYIQYFTRPPLQQASFEGQTVIVTGANIGLGLEAARHLVKLHAAKVILACRSVEKGAAAKADIEASTGTSGVVEVWHLDLASYDSVKEFAARAAALPRLDVLLENAGIATSKFRLQEDNEATITTNVVSTMLLGLLLLPKLKESAKVHNTKTHLVIVSSEVHFLTKLPERNDGPSIFAALNDPHTKRMRTRYFASKLLEVFAVRQLVEERCPDADAYPVVINFVNPSFNHSSLMREAGFWQYVLKFLGGAWSPDVGSRSLVAAACIGPEGHGQYVTSCKVEPPAPFVLTDEGKKTQERVWKELSAKLEKIQPGILSNI